MSIFRDILDFFSVQNTRIKLIPFALYQASQDTSLEYPHEEKIKCVLKWLLCKIHCFKPIFFLSEKSVVAISSYLWLSWTILDYLGLSRTISDYLGLHRTISDDLRLSWTISDYTRLSLIILEYLGLSQAISGYLRLSRAISDYFWLSWTILD